MAYLLAIYRSQVVASSEQTSAQSVWHYDRYLSKHSAYLIQMRYVCHDFYCNAEAANTYVCYHHSIGGQNFSVILDTGSSDLVSACLANILPVKSIAYLHHFFQVDSLVRVHILGLPGCIQIYHILHIVNHDRAVIQTFVSARIRSRKRCF
jgi:hypothetical protein